MKKSRFPIRLCDPELLRIGAQVAHLVSFVRPRMRA